MSNDTYVYEHAFTGERLTGRELDPSGSGYVPTHWTWIPPAYVSLKIGDKVIAGAGMPATLRSQFNHGGSQALVQWINDSNWHHSLVPWSTVHPYEAGKEVQP